MSNKKASHRMDHKKTANLVSAAYRTLESRGYQKTSDTIHGTVGNSEFLEKREHMGYEELLYDFLVNHNKPRHDKEILPAKEVSQDLESEESIQIGLYVSEENGSDNIDTYVLADDANQLEVALGSNENLSRPDREPVVVGMEKEDYYRASIQFGGGEPASITIGYYNKPKSPFWNIRSEVDQDIKPNPPDTTIGLEMELNSTATEEQVSENVKKLDEGVEEWVKEMKSALDG